MGSGRLAVAALLAAGLVGALPVAQGGSLGGEIVFRRGGVLQPQAELFSVQLGGDPRNLNRGQTEGFASLAAVSPDGRQVAILLDRYTGLDLYVVAIDGHGRRRIAERVLGERVSWSPDGRRLAFEMPAGASSEVHAADATGTGRRMLLGGAREPSWSPDGSRIAVLAGERVVVIRPDGRRLWSAAGSRATWSPDGSLLAVDRSGAVDNRTVVLNAAGARRASVAGRSATWSPDGSRLALLRDDKAGAATGTFLFELGSGRPARRVGPVGDRLEWSRSGHLAINGADRAVWVLAPGTGTAQRRIDGRLVGFSADGRRLSALRSTTSRQDEIVVAGANGERPRSVLLAPLGSHYLAAPSWAGNATLVYQRRRISADSDLYLARPDGTELRQVTGTLERDTDPDWSPDGTTLVFSRSASPFDQADDDVALWKLPAGGGGPSRLTTPDGLIDVDADWSPDGSRLVFARETGHRSELFVVGADGNGIRRIGTSRTARTPSWSPDGMLIAFARGTPDGVEVAVIAPDGSGRRTLIPPGGGEGLGNPAWAPDGQWLAFDDGRSVFVARADGTQIRRITSGHGPVAWSPDGARLLVVDETETRSFGAPTSLWSVGADGADRRRVTHAEARDSDPDWRP